MSEQKIPAHLRPNWGKLHGEALGLIERMADAMRACTTQDPTVPAPDAETWDALVAEAERTVQFGRGLRKLVAGMGGGLETAEERPAPTALYVGKPHGSTTADEVSVFTHRHEAGDDEPQLLDPRFDLANHSPTGFQWGYGGSGPAQLALAICADALGDDERAMAIYQRFKFRVIGRLPTGKVWSLTREDVLATLAELEAERPNAV